MAISGIYKYTNKSNEKVYIGQSVNIVKRKWEHEHTPSKASKFDKLLNAIGVDNFDFVIIEECPISALDTREIYWIDTYDSTNPDKGYNILRGGTSKLGENNPSAKLNNKDVLEIIQLLKDGKMVNHEIAEIYGVHQNCIDQINRCQSWTHLHNYKSNIRKENNLNIGKGESSRTSKISEKIALDIINELKVSSLSFPKIAEKCGASIHIVEDINRCRTWKHLHNYKNNIRVECRKEVML